MTIREFDDADLGLIVELIQATSTPGASSVFSLGDLVRTLTDDEQARAAVVAVHDNAEICGVAVARIEGDRAWLLRWAVATEHREAGLGTALLRRLEQRLMSSGVSSLLVLVPPDNRAASALGKADYEIRSGASVFEKTNLNPSAAKRRAESLGAEWLEQDRWEQIGGMEREKALIDEDIILPLANPIAAQHHGVAAPSAVILFGPPGTGKTTFAKAIAARLGWPFIEVLSTQLSGDSHHAQARSLRERIEDLFRLDQLVVFLDEVDDLARARSSSSPSPAVTNELLKLVPSFRHGERLLICATNTVSELDPAFVRPGRFDCIIPIGPPDGQARAEIWRRYASRGVTGEIDFDALVARTERFSAADIEFAAGKAAHQAFKRGLANKTPAEAVTDDFLLAISKMRPSITVEQLDEFERDAERHSRY